MSEQFRVENFTFVTGKQLLSFDIDTVPGQSALLWLLNYDS